MLLRKLQLTSTKNSASTSSVSARTSAINSGVVLTSGGILLRMLLTSSTVQPTSPTLLGRDSIVPLSVERKLSTGGGTRIRLPRRRKRKSRSFRRRRRRRLSRVPRHSTRFSTASSQMLNYLVLLTSRLHQWKSLKTTVLRITFPIKTGKR